MTTRECRGAHPTVLLIAVLLLAVCANAGAGCNSGTRDPAGAGGTSGSGGAGGTGSPSACPGTLNGSCRYNSGSNCNEYAGLTATELDPIERDCEGDNLGTWTAGRACDRTGSIGGCRVLEAPFCRVGWEFMGAAAEAMSDCIDDGGTWITP
jgi:hypothetical protein